MKRKKEMENSKYYLQNKRLLLTFSPLSSRILPRRSCTISGESARSPVSSGSLAGIHDLHSTEASLPNRGLIRVSDCSRCLTHPLLTMPNLNPS